MFPTGKPKNIIRGKDLAKVKITAKGAFYKKKQIYGVAHVRVKVKPSNYPFLVYR